MIPGEGPKVDKKMECPDDLILKKCSFDKKMLF